MSRFSFFTQSRFRSKKNESTRTGVGNILALMDTTRIRVALLFGIVIFGLLYLWLVNSSASAGFYLSDLEQQVVALETDYKQLQVAQVELESLEHIQQKSQEVKMVAAGKAEYIHDGTGVAFVEGE